MRLPGGYGCCATGHAHRDGSEHSARRTGSAGQPRRSALTTSFTGPSALLGVGSGSTSGLEFRFGAAVARLGRGLGELGFPTAGITWGVVSVFAGSISNEPAQVAMGSPGPGKIRSMRDGLDEVDEFRITLRSIGNYPQLLQGITERRDEAASKGDSNMTVLWNRLATQVAAVRDNDKREWHAKARDFSAPAMGEN